MAWLPRSLRWISYLKESFFSKLTKLIFETCMKLWPSLQVTTDYPLFVWRLIYSFYFCEMWMHILRNADLLTSLYCDLNKFSFEYTKEVDGSLYFCKNPDVHSFFKKCKNRVHKYVHWISRFPQNSSSSFISFYSADFTVVPFFWDKKFSAVATW